MGLGGGLHELGIVREVQETGGGRHGEPQSMQ
jgi:hypothetical protein